jgi:PHS family inorganic phosphate transporter-like MFS transporter
MFSGHETNLNAIALFGSVIGQLVFGYLADKFGRRKVFGLELFLVTLGTVGFLGGTIKEEKSMSTLAWLAFWRFFMGVGIGAEYPLSAVITSE